MGIFDLACAYWIFTCEQEDSLLEVFLLTGCIWSHLSCKLLQLVAGVLWVLLV